MVFEIFEIKLVERLLWDSICRVRWTGGADYEPFLGEYSYSYRHSEKWYVRCGLSSAHAMMFGFLQLTSTCINLHQLTSTYINLHQLTSTYMGVSWNRGTPPDIVHFERWDLPQKPSSDTPCASRRPRCSSALPKPPRNETEKAADPLELTNTCCFDY